MSRINDINQLQSLQCIEIFIKYIDVWWEVKFLSDFLFYSVTEHMLHVFLHICFNRFVLHFAFCLSHTLSFITLPQQTLQERLQLFLTFLFFLHLFLILLHLVFGRMFLQTGVGSVGTGVTRNWNSIEFSNYTIIIK